MMPPEDCRMPHEIYLSDLEIWLRDKLRDQPFYPSLRRIVVAQSNRHPCGWVASVSGNLTCAEQALCEGIVQAMQRRYDLTTKQDFPLYVSPEPTERVAGRSMRST
jgi:hypothetical protein